MFTSRFDRVRLTILFAAKILIESAEREACAREKAKGS